MPAGSPSVTAMALTAMVANTNQSNRRVGRVSSGAATKKIAASGGQAQGGYWG